MFRRVMIAFLRLLDADYDGLFTCPICCSKPHSELVLIIDGKEMGIQRVYAKDYTRPVDKAIPVPQIL
jgi:hypothetical protein